MGRILITQADSSIDNPLTTRLLWPLPQDRTDTHQVNFNAAAPYLYRTNTAGLPGEARRQGY